MTAAPQSIQPEIARETQESICAWTEATFGPASTNARVAARANEEMAELLRALTADDNHPKAVEEAADVVIILYRLAQRMGFDLQGDDTSCLAVRVQGLKLEARQVTGRPHAGERICSKCQTAIAERRGKF